MELVLIGSETSIHTNPTDSRLHTVPTWPPQTLHRPHTDPESGRWEGPCFPCCKEIQASVLSWIYDPATDTVQQKEAEHETTISSHAEHCEHCPGSSRHVRWRLHSGTASLPSLEALTPATRGRR